VALVLIRSEGRAYNRLWAKALRLLPYFYISAWEYGWEVRRFNTAFENYCAAVFAGPEKIVALLKTGVETLKRAEELASNFKSSCESSGLNPFDIVRAVANNASNIITLKDGLSKMDNLKKVIEQALKDLKELIPKFPDMVAHADDIGKKCH